MDMLFNLRFFDAERSVKVRLYVEAVSTQYDAPQLFGKVRQAVDDRNIAQEDPDS